MSRRCDKCGETYYRRNQVILWILRNPGKRRGWRQQLYTLCLSCLTMPTAQKFLMLTGLRLGLPSAPTAGVAPKAIRVAARAKAH